MITLLVNDPYHLCYACTAGPVLLRNGSLHEKLDKTKIGHFGLFSRRFKNHIWPLMLGFVEQQLEGKFAEKSLNGK
jgi:hypothetical protein